MVIGVDFDGTIVEHEYPRIGKPIPFAIDVLKRLEADGHTLILWTVRTGALLQEAIDYCESQGLTFYAHNRNFPEEEFDEEKISRKISTDIFIDDRNIGGLPDWGHIYQVIKSGKNSFNVLDRIDNDREEKKNWLVRFGEAWDKSRGRRY